MPGEEKTPDSPNKKGLKRPMSSGGGSQKKKSCRDVNAPKMPMSGYIRFLVEGRLRMQENPNPDRSSDTTTQQDLAHLAREWKSLSAEAKRVYNERAEQERAVYRKQLEAYKKTDAYKQFQRKLQKEKGNKATSSGKKADEDDYDETYGSDSFPVFSKEFLTHNKERESELRKLRNEVLQLEDEENGLNQNIARLKAACDQRDNELANLNSYNTEIEKRMGAYRQCLLNAFANCPLPGSSASPSADTIDDYMNNLHKLCLSASSENQDFLAKVRDIVRRLKLPNV